VTGRANVWRPGGGLFKNVTLSSETCYGLLLKLLRNAGSPRNLPIGSSMIPHWLPGIRGAKRRFRGGKEEKPGKQRGAKGVASGSHPGKYFSEVLIVY
jgi:hypothetical protein